MNTYEITEMLTYRVEASNVGEAVALVHNNLGNLETIGADFLHCDVQPYSDKHHTFDIEFCETCFEATTTKHNH